MTRIRSNGGILGLNNTTSLTSAYGVFALAEQGYYQQAGKWPTVPGPLSVVNSLRFKNGSSTYMSRTPSVAGNRQKFTMSLWIKRGDYSTANGQWIFGASTGTANQDCYLCWGGSVSTGGSADTLSFFSPAAGNNISLITNALYRDYSAWYHIVCAVDTTQATAANRVLLYVNGQQITSFSTANYPTLNQNLNFNSTNGHDIGSAFNVANFLDGYLAEFNFIDGQQLGATSFGSFDINGIWQPAAYNGSYGTNGFHLTFGNTTSTTTLGYDTSGNGNNWSTNNFSLTAGVSYDAMTDSPMNVSSTVGNYAILNPLSQLGGVVPLYLANGNLQFTNSAGNGAWMRLNSSIPIYANTGKYYWEATITVDQNSTSNIVCITPVTDVNAYPGTNGYGISWNVPSYGLVPSGTVTGTPTVGDVIMMAYDSGTGSLWIGKNGVWVAGNPSAGTGASFTGLTGNWIPAFGTYTNSSSNAGYGVNFGQQPFSYTPPTGFNRLNTNNLAASTIPNGAAYFASTLYTGNGTNSPNALIITNSAYNNAGTAFQPDFTWVKSRSLVSDHILQDSVRGLSEFLVSDTTGAAQATGGGDVSAYTSTGFNISYNNTRDNQAAATYVAWQWQAGKGTTATNTNGSITSTVSANPTAGFSVVTFTTQASGVATVGHGLNSAPSFIITKTRGVTAGWVTYHASVGNTGYLYLNSTSAFTTDSTIWNNTSPSSTVFTLGSGYVGSYSYLAYCWAAVAGYSAFGSYTGNGSTDGPFIYLGFRPRWIMIKRTDSTANWIVEDTSRSIYNVTAAALYPNLTNAEDTSYSWDIISNGIKIRDNPAGDNASGGTYIYAAFAENPFNTARAR